MQYTKYLVARFSPENGCNADEGEPLIVRAKARVAVRTVQPHQFEGARTGKSSRFGWVSEMTQPFVIEGYLAPVAEPLSESDLAATQKMLDVAGGLAVDTPVGCDYRKDGLSSKMNLWIHRVGFYPAK